MEEDLTVEDRRHCAEFVQRALGIVAACLHGDDAVMRTLITEATMGDGDGRNTMLILARFASGGVRRVADRDGVAADQLLARWCLDVSRSLDQEFDQE